MKTSKLTKLIISAIFLMACLSAAQSVVASESTKNKKSDEVQYHEANLKNFAKTYWRFSKFDYTDDKAIDNFMRISECDLYKEYIHNEFEWNGIRESTRNFLKDNKNKFPDRYAFVQAMALGSYNFEEKFFNIAEEHALRGAKSFEMSAEGQGVEICGNNRPIAGYPRLMALELTRPLIFDKVPMDPDIASAVIAAKMKNYENLPPSQKTRERYLEARKVYLVAKVKMFAHKPGLIRNDRGQDATKMLGILESIEVYEGPNLSKMLYKKDFRRKKKKKKKDF